MTREELVAEATEGNRSRQATEQTRLMFALDSRVRLAEAINKEIVAASNDGEVTIEVHSDSLSFEYRIADAVVAKLGLRGGHNGEPDHCLACLAFHDKLGEAAA